MEKIIKMLEDKDLIIIVKKEGHVEYVSVDYIDDNYYFDNNIQSGYSYSNPMKAVCSFEVLKRLYPELSFSIAECVNTKTAYREIDSSIYELIDEEKIAINNKITEDLQELFKKELEFKISFTINGEMKFLKQLPTVSILSMKSVDEMERFLTDEFEEAKVLSPEKLQSAPTNFLKDIKDIHKDIFDMLKSIRYIFENYLPPIHINNLFHQIVRDEINESAKDYNII